MNAWDQHTVNVLISNDTLGPGPISEWDDLRTYGIDCSVLVGNRFNVEVDYESLTWRGASPPEASRLDTLNAMLGWRLPSLPMGVLRLDSNLAAGVEILGDLGGASLQGIYHRAAGICRPIPESYDSLSAMAPAGALSSRLFWEHGLWRAALLAGLVGELSVGFRAGAGVQLGVGTADSGIALTLRSLLDPVRGISPTLDKVSAAESGAVLALDCATGHLKSSLELNLTSGGSCGSIGFQFGRTAEGSSHGLPLAIEVAFPPASPSTSCKILVPVLGPLVRFSASQAGGWWEQTNAGPTALRFADYSLGLEGRLLFALGWLEVQTACGLRPCLTVITRQPIGVERSSILDRSLQLGMRVEPLVRIGFLEKKDEGRRLISGFAVAVDLSVPFWNPLFAQTPAVKVMLFSEQR